MEPEIIERKVREIIEYSKDDNPMLRVIKFNGEAKFGVFIEIANVEGAGRTLFIRDVDIYMLPLVEIADV